MGRCKLSPHLQGRVKTVQTNSSAACWAGIDVSKDWVDVVVLQDEKRVEQGRWERTEDGLAELAGKLTVYAPQGIVLEATGGLERVVITSLMAVGLPVMRMNPKRVRDFAKAQGLLAKTDKLDAYALGLFGARMQPPMRTLPDAGRQQLMLWLARQRQLVTERAMERTRLHQVTDKELRRSIERVVAFLGKELARLDKQLQVLLQKFDGWKEQEALLRSAPGVGPKTALVLAVEMPELGQLNRREVAALVGLAPYACDSGKWRGRRRIQGGRAVVRAALYLASWTAVRQPGRLKDFYQRLVAAGKPRQLALIAVARKLLLALNQMVRSSKPWDSSLGCLSA